MWRVVLAALLMLAGCSKQKNSSEQPKLDICGLVTQTEMETFLGTRLKPPELKNDIICMYASAEADKDVKTASLLVRYSLETTDPQQAYAQYEAEFKKPEIKAKMGGEYQMQPVAGLGVPAGWNETHRQLTFFTGKYMVIVGAHLPKDQPPLEIARKIATQALARLPKS